MKPRRSFQEVLDLLDGYTRIPPLDLSVSGSFVRTYNILVRTDSMTITRMLWEGKVNGVPCAMYMVTEDREMKHRATTTYYCQAPKDAGLIEAATDIEAVEEIEVLSGLDAEY